MSEVWHSVCARDEVQAGAMLPIEIGDMHIAVYNVDDEYFATDNICTHGFALLTDGFLDGDSVECALHGGCFNIRTGKALCEPVDVDLRTFRTRLVDDRVEVCIDGA
ncbi:non-heme iron oxygenase ferredoxin subunit [Afipia clevelandensis]|uniref:Rieske domain-containing protein n=1 Tax=Afipia clevelandensis ATCC 49720 TaxID=883079 RepID=K8NNM0_9BRAD|nr:non-heme iron oxygenase ferredoxin subunit [Afipia clevelandensis]EKS31947.1 hypothetical protein HMPREF9696_04168 [Afipia clevelandensis ATCC 49720]